jgi:hypothetical protein
VLLTEQGVSLYDDAEKHFIFPLRSKIVATDMLSLWGKQVMLKKFRFKECKGRDRSETISEDVDWIKVTS